MSPLHHLRLIMAFALLISPAYAQNFPYAKDTFKNNELQHWSLEEVRAYRDKVIGDLTDKKTIPEKDNAACSALLGYWSKQVEGKRVEEQDNTNGDDPEAVIFKTELDLTAHDGLVYFALQVDDEATLTVTEIPTSAEPTGHTPITETYDIKGTALWRVGRSYKEFSNSIPAGRKYDLRLNYLNTANLTDKYDGLVDYDGVNVFLMHHPAVDLDVDSNNTEGFDFTWGSEPEDKIEVSPSLPGKIIAVPIEPDADNDGIPDYKDFGGITPGPDKQFVQMVVHLPPNYDPETATVTFDYPMSATTNGSSIEPPNSGFRIWTKNGHSQRSLDAVPVAPAAAPDPAPGYLVKDGDPILWKNLAANCEEAEAGRYPGPALILYLETVITYNGGSLSTSEPEQIKVTAKNGSTSDESKTEDVVNITVRCTGGVKISGPKAIMVNDNHHNRDASGNQIDKWDYTNDRTGTLDPDVLPIAIEVTALDQDVWVTLSSEAMKGLGEPGTPDTGGLIDGVFPGDSEPSGTATDPAAQSKIGWKSAPYTFKIDKNTTFKQNLYIEGQRHSATVDDVVIKLETTGEGIETGDPKTCIATTEAEHKMTVYQVDLDVDSNNNEGFEFTSGSDEEDWIESSTRVNRVVYPEDVIGEPRYGKIIVNNNRTDSASLDLLINGGAPGLASVSAGLKFVPVLVELKEPFDPATTKVKFEYDASEPKVSADGIEKSGAGTPTDPFIYKIKKGGMRLWKKDASARTSVTADYIPSSTEIPWTDLTSSGTRKAMIYLEYVDTDTPQAYGQKEMSVIAEQSGFIKSKDIVNIYLLSVEILDKDKKPLNLLKFAKMSETGVLYKSGLYTSYTLNINQDSDRFYVRLRGASSMRNASIKVSTIENKNVNYDDNETEIELQIEGNDLISKSMILVSDNIDDDHVVDNVADDYKNDRTHKMQLGGKFKINSIKIDNTECAGEIKILTKVERKVSFEAVIVRNSIGGLPAISKNDLEVVLETLRERYAQVGINFDWTIREVDPPVGVDLSDGLDTTVLLTPEIRALFTHLTTPSVDDMQVFILNKFHRPGFLHYGRAYPVNVAAGNGYVNSVIINSLLLTGNEGHYTIAHEIGHVLTNDGHFGGETGSLTEEEKRNLMARGGEKNNSLDIGGGKRLNLSQESDIKSHSLIQNP